MKSSLTPQEFVSKWSATRLKERSASQEHFLDLCALLNHSTPAELDPKGEFFGFEAGARATGGKRSQIRRPEYVVVGAI